MPHLALMEKVGRITPLSQYIIDRIRERRLELGISAKMLSEKISQFNGDSVVGNIESIKTSLKYTTSTLKKAVKALGWTLKDVLPAELLPDDTLQDKTKIPILKGMTMPAILNSLLEEGYFDEPRDRNEITAYCNTFYDKDNQKEVTDFSAALEDFYLKHSLIKIEPNKEKGEKLIKFQKNPDNKEEA